MQHQIKTKNCYKVKQLGDSIADTKAFGRHCVGGTNTSTTERVRQHRQPCGKCISECVSTMPGVQDSCNAHLWHVATKCVCACGAFEKVLFGKVANYDTTALQMAHATMAHSHTDVCMT